MEEFLGIFIQICFETLLNTLTTIPWEFFFYKGDLETQRRTLRSLISCGVGMIVGLISLNYFPHSMITLKSWQVVGIILSPLCAGFAAKFIANIINRTKEVWPDNHFLYAFWLCLGYVFVRFLGTHA